MRHIDYLEEYNKQKTILANIEKSITEQLKKALDRYNDALAGKFENNERVLSLSSITIEVKKHALSIILKKIEFLRPGTEEDMADRLSQYHDFSKNVKEVVPDNLPLRFHGSPIYNARSIISDGQISSSVDRLGFSTSWDVSKQISVTTRDSIDISVRDYTDLITSYMPCGCIFVLLPKDDIDAKSGTSLLMGNVNFKKEADRLVSVITSKENVNCVKQWMIESGLDPKKVKNFEEFIKHYAELKESNLAEEIVL